MNHDNKIAAATVIIMSGLIVLIVGLLYYVAIQPAPNYSFNSGAQLFACNTTVSRTDVPIYALLNGTQTVGQCVNVEQALSADTAPTYSTTNIIMVIVLVSVLILALIIEFAKRPKG